jgi:hypothetical protein
LRSPLSPGNSPRDTQPTPPSVVADEARHGLLPTHLIAAEAGGTSMMQMNPGSSDRMVIEIMNSCRLTAAL